MKNSKLANGVIFLLVLFNLIFPKGGIKIDEIPITIGMVLLIITLCYRFLHTVSQKNFLILPKQRAFLLFSWIPFQVVLLVCMVVNGIENVGAALSMSFNFIFLPWMLFLGEGNHFDRLQKTFLLKFIRHGILFVAIYGIGAFLYTYSTGDFIEIPFLTVNYDDIGNIENKNLSRGNGFFKLISTYQNGNIYGVSLLLLLPLYAYLEKRAVPQCIVKASLILTLSRTVWIGLVVYEFLRVTFIKFSIKKIVVFNLMICFLMLSVQWLISLMGKDMVTFLLDKELGGRAGYIETIEIGLLPQNAVGGINEIVYMGIIGNFGLIGLFCFLLALLMPIWLYIQNKQRSDLQRNLLCGYMIYLVIAGSDGAILLIPVMIFFWFVLLLLTINYKENKE